MKTILIGADYEENLGMGMIAAALRRAGHRVRIQVFDDETSVDEVATAVIARHPRLVGLAMQFQHRAAANVMLARRLRELGYRGHITCGGQHPTMAHRELLADVAAIDSVVLHEGEATVVELVAALESGRTLGAVQGLALRGPAGLPIRTLPRPLANALDDLPFTHRYRAHLRHLGMPFIPVWGSRGCWGSCSFCAITTAHREAKRHAPSRMFRLRSVENLATEMAALWHREQSSAIFCFHDDTLLLPRPEDSLARLRSLRQALDNLGVGELGIVGKCRPDCVTPDLAHALRRLGVFRMFVGIENGSQAGLDHLHRRTKTSDLENALSAFGEAGIYACYNLLLFEPDATLDNVRENVAFMRAHAEFPVNFCRAEAYHGTPLYQNLLQRDALIGNYLGWDYRISDDRTELAFRMSAAVFRERNFDALGVANRYIGVAYLAQLLKTFFNCSGTEERRVLQRSHELVLAITRESADFLERIVDMAAQADLRDSDAIVRQTARLGLELSACNRLWHTALDELEASIRCCAEQNPRKRSMVRLPERAKAIFQQLTLAGCLVTALPGCGGDTEDSGGNDNTSGQNALQSGGGGSGTTNAGGRTVLDPVPAGGRSFGGFMGDGGVSPTGGRGLGGIMDAVPTGGRGSGGWISDPGGTTSTGGRATGGRLMGDGGVPPTGGRSAAGAAGALSVGGKASGGFTVVDPAPTGGRGFGGLNGDGGVPPTAGNSAGGNAGRSATGGAAVVDPPPPPRAANSCVGDQPSAATSTEPTEHWRDTRPARLTRSQDLPLWDPPEVVLRARLEDGKIAVALCTSDVFVSTRWQGQGVIESGQSGASWQPASRDDQITVCVRSEGGIAFATLRAADIPGYAAG